MTEFVRKLLSVLTSLLLALLLVSGAIAVPILWRGWYYAQINSLALPARTGWSPQVIREAFDQVMDYLVGDAPFATGSLRWSESGRAHFADCRVLFRLDFLVLGLSAAALALVLLPVLTGRVRLYRFGSRGPCFWALMGLLAAVVLLGGWALLDFNSFFTAFHVLCFPGKTNWIFDWRTDEIILILPEAFWARTGALVGGLALGGGALLTLGEWRFAPREGSVYEELKHWSGK